MEKVISNKELKERMNWNFDQKIDHSLYVIENFLAQYPEAVISYSGGLDSTVMLHLVRIVDKNKKGIFCNTTNEFNEIVKFVKQTENIETILPKINFINILKNYGFPLISKNVANMLDVIKHPNSNNALTINCYLKGITGSGYKTKVLVLPKKWQYLINAPFNFTSKCCYFLKKKPMRKHSKNGIFIGTKAQDSMLRSIQYQKIGCINEKKHKCTPLSIWTKDDIWKFINKNNIPYCDIYDKGEISTGCAYCGFGCQFDIQRFNRLKIREPKRYEIMMAIENNGIPYWKAIEMVNKRTLNIQKTLF